MTWQVEFDKTYIKLLFLLNLYSLDYNMMYTKMYLKQQVYMTGITYIFVDSTIDSYYFSTDISHPQMIT